MSGFKNRFQDSRLRDGRIARTALGPAFGVAVTLAPAALARESAAQTTRLPNPAVVRWWVVPINPPCECSTRTPTFGRSVNDCGEVVGDTRTSIYCDGVPWAWSLCGTLGTIASTLPQETIDLRGLGGTGAGVARGTANGINNDAVVVGALDLSGGSLATAHWWHLGTMVPSGSCESGECLCRSSLTGQPISPPGTQLSALNAVAEGGIGHAVGTVGSLGSGTDPLRAFWIDLSLPSAPTFLPPVSGVAHSETGAYSIASRLGTDLVVGFSAGTAPWAGPTGADEAAVWSVSSAGMTGSPLSKPPFGAWSAVATGVNTGNGTTSNPDVAGFLIAASVPSGAASAAAWIAGGSVSKLADLVPGGPSRAWAVSERDSHGDVVICGGAAQEYAPSTPAGFVWWTATTPTMMPSVLGGVAFHGADFNAGALEIALPPELSGAMSSTTAPVIVELRDVNALGWMTGTIVGPGLPDAQAALVLPAALQSDLDNDGFVDSPDITLLLNAWGACTAVGYCLGDLDGSGAVDSADFAYLLNEWAPQIYAGQPRANSLALACERLSCRGIVGAEPVLAAEIVEIFACFGCCDSGELACFLSQLSPEPRDAVIATIRERLEVQR